MVFVAVDHSSTLQVESKISEKRFAEDSVVANCIKVCESPLGSSHEEHIPAGGVCNEEIASAETLDKGYLNYGCSHYRRRFRIRAPCCNEIFDCRHCHNEAKNNICIDQKLRHDIPRHLLEKVICSLCHTEQEAGFSLFTLYTCVFMSIQQAIGFNKFAGIVGCAWEDTIVEFANCMMMIYLKSSIIAMVVVFAGLEAPRIFSTVINVNAAILCF